MRARRAVPFIITAAVAVVVAVVAGIAVLGARGAADDRAATASASPVRDDTRYLDRVDDPEVTVVEFLDFECEACGAFHPHVEQIRERYAGRIDFAFRYFPLPGHGNAVNAALAVEAAAQQDAGEGMYTRLFETQSAWGERGGESQAPLFRDFARELGLDLDRYDAAVADAATLARIESDFEDGRALGVQSTPTFFVDGEIVELSAFDDLDRAIAAALAD